jgi:glycosyltransferase involved in cell wall biosynthesis
LRILWLSHFVPYPPAGGNLQRSYNLIRRLAERHEVILIAFNRRRSLPRASDRDEAAQHLGRFCSGVDVFPIEAERGIPQMSLVVLRNLARRSPVTTDMLASRPALDAVRRALAREVDLFHIDTIDLAPYARLAGETPTVLQHHNVESLLLRRRTAYETNVVRRAYLGLQTSRIERLEAKECGRHALNLVVSETDARCLSAIAPDARFAVVPNGVDVDFYRPEASVATEQSIVWAGGMRWFPNRDAIRHFLAGAWPALVARRPGTTFHLIGHAPPDEARTPGVTAHGFVEDIRPIVGRAAVYVVPIRIGGGTRLKILDAMAMGKAIVSTSVGCEGLHVTPGVDIMVADRPDEFAALVARLLDDEGLRRRLGCEARKTAERLYGWDQIERQLEELYDGVLRDSAGVRVASPRIGRPEGA